MERRELKELNLLDDFLFQEIMSREEGKEFCRILLKTILGKEIKDIEIISQKNVLGRIPGKHGIKIDAYMEATTQNEIEEVDKVITNIALKTEIFDIEPNTYHSKNEARRTRYYHSLIDSKILNSGVSYEKLKNVMIIMILPYDPFGEDRMVYTFKKQCMENPAIPYDEGVTTMYLYTKGKSEKASQELCDMLKYIENSTKENITNNDLEKLDHMVENIRHDAEIGVSYMKSWEREEMLVREGREKQLIEIVCKKMQKGYSEKEIADFLEEPLDIIQKACEAVRKYEPEYDVDMIWIEFQELLYSNF